MDSTIVTRKRSSESTTQLLLWMSSGEAGIRIRTGQSTRDYRGCRVAFLHSERSRHPVPSAFRSSIARPTDTSVYASSANSRCRLQDSRPGWIRCFLSCRALSSPTTCRFIPALSGLPTNRELLPRGHKRVCRDECSEEASLKERHCRIMLGHCL